jgi:hypothetical protein
MKYFIVVLMSIGLISLNSGCCVHHPHETGFAYYSMGEYYSTEKIPLDQAWNGTLKAMEELGFFVTKQQKSALTAYLIARGTGDKKIEVKLEKQSEEVTQIRIRVDAYGDESISKLILDKIKERSKSD